MMYSSRTRASAGRHLSEHLRVARRWTHRVGGRDVDRDPLVGLSVRRQPCARSSVDRDLALAASRQDRQLELLCPAPNTSSVAVGANCQTLRAFFSESGSGAWSGASRRGLRAAGVHAKCHAQRGRIDVEPGNGAGRRDRSAHARRGLGQPATARCPRVQPRRCQPGRCRARSGGVTVRSGSPYVGLTEPAVSAASRTTVIRCPVRIVPFRMRPTAIRPT